MYMKDNGQHKFTDVEQFLSRTWLVWHTWSRLTLVSMTDTLQPGSVRVSILARLSVMKSWHVRLSTALRGVIALQVNKLSLKLHRSAVFPLANSRGHVGSTV